MYICICVCTVCTKNYSLISNGFRILGAYDLRQAEIKVKDEYNRLGGSYDHNGVFHRANGYWDENYEWVPYEGYVNEKGRFVKFAKVEGDLSFMV